MTPEQAKSLKVGDTIYRVRIVGPSNDIAQNCERFTVSRVSKTGSTIWTNTRTDPCDPSGKHVILQQRWWRGWEVESLWPSEVEAWAAVLRIAEYNAIRLQKQLDAALAEVRRVQAKLKKESNE